MRAGALEIARAEMILLIMLGEPLEKKIFGGGFVPTGFESGAFKPECRGHRQGPATEDRANPRKPTQKHDGDLLECGCHSFY